MRLLVALVLFIFAAKNGIVIEGKDHVVAINNNPFNIEIKQGEGINFNSRDGKLHALMFENESEPFAIISQEGSKYVNFPEKGDYIIKDAKNPEASRSLIRVVSNDQKAESWFKEDARVQAKKASNMELDEGISAIDAKENNAVKENNAAKPSSNATAKPSSNVTAKPSSNVTAKPSSNVTAKPSSNAAKPSANKQNSDDSSSSAPSKAPKKAKEASSENEEKQEPKTEEKSGNGSSIVAINLAVLAISTIFALVL